MRYGPVALCIAFLLAMQATTFAQPRLELVATSDLASDPTALAIGSPATFLVVLSDLPADASLVSLSATVTFSAENFAVGAIEPGQIIPEPLDDPWDFLSLADAGIVDATYLTFSPLSEHHIAGDGVFYAFTLTPIEIGTASIRFDFVDAFYFDPANPDLPLPAEILSGPSLDLQIIQVPEPPSLGPACIGAALLLTTARTRRRLPR